MSLQSRILEASGGSISIDGVNISQLGLQKLRSRITIIPQVTFNFLNRQKIGFKMKYKITGSSFIFWLHAPEPWSFRELFRPWGSKKHYCFACFQCQSPNLKVWRALEHAHLRTFVAALPDGLQHVVSEGGTNLSVGQRQLICLAR